MKLVYTVFNILSLVNRDIKLTLRLTRQSILFSPNPVYHLRNSLPLCLKVTSDQVSDLFLLYSLLGTVTEFKCKKFELKKFRSLHITTTLVQIISTYEVNFKMVIFLADYNIALKEMAVFAYLLEGRMEPQRI